MADKQGDPGLHSSNVEWFTRSVSGKPTVTSVARESERVFRVTREKDELLVYLANIYILGEADVDGILADNAEVDVIVNVNSYNTHTLAAKTLADARGVALFKASEFMGAVYRYDQEFMEYTAPE